MPTADPDVADPKQRNHLVLTLVELACVSGLVIVAGEKQLGVYANMSAELPALLQLLLAARWAAAGLLPAAMVLMWFFGARFQKLRLCIAIGYLFSLVALGWLGALVFYLWKLLPRPD